MAWWNFGKKKEKIQEEVPVSTAEAVQPEEAAAAEAPQAAEVQKTPFQDAPQKETQTEENTGEDVIQETEKQETDEARPEKKGFSWFGKKKETSADTAENDEDDEEEDVPQEKPQKKKGFFARLKEGLAKTRDSFVYNLDVVFDGAEMIDDDFYDDLEEILIMGDIGVGATEAILDRLKEQVEEEDIVRPAECKRLLIKDIREQMAVGKAAYAFEKQTSVIFVIGVNGVGKTTSIGKIASMLKAKRRRVMMAAADTFRAAAGDQLKIWAERAGVELIGGKEGQDPSSVLFDAVNAAKARHVDVLLVDTAGRLNNKKNLMEELKKMNRVIDREYPDVHRENLIVLDATTGQNALQQARDFNDVADLTGIILTKMDGTAKGGIAVAIQSELKVPVKYIGVGEKIEDLQKFDPDAFVEALFDVELERDDEEDEDNENGETI
ncbi:MAG: signal recognition particle-docking protein FtsY [Lachnospiraceae bacterium]|nr:signal recognition particle-docking protein FtsY [Lachnospiraceae bacterium]